MEYVVLILFGLCRSVPEDIIQIIKCLSLFLFLSLGLLALSLSSRLVLKCVQTTSSQRRFTSNSCYIANCWLYHAMCNDSTHG